VLKLVFVTPCTFCVCLPSDWSFPSPALSLSWLFHSLHLPSASPDCFIPFTCPQPLLIVSFPSPALSLSWLFHSLHLTSASPDCFIPFTCPQPLLIVSFPSPALNLSWLFNSLHLPSATPVSLIPDVPHLCFPTLYILPVFALSPARLLCVLSLVSIRSWPVCFDVKTFVSQTWSRTVLLHLSLPVWTWDSFKTWFGDYLQYFCWLKCAI